MGTPSFESDRTRVPVRLRQALEPVLAAIVPPLTAFAVEIVFWPMIPRLLLFNAAVIVSSWVGGLKSGIVATILSTMLVARIETSTVLPSASRLLSACTRAEGMSGMSLGIWTTTPMDSANS